MGRDPKPGPVVIPGCSEGKILFSQNGEQQSIVCHGSKGSTTIDETYANSLASAIASSVISSGWASHMAAGSSFDGVEVKDLSSPHQPSYLSNIAGTPAAGLATPLAASSAIAVTKQSAKSGKEFTGRMYLGCLDSSVTTDGRHATQAAMDAAGSFAEGIRQAFQTAGTPMVIANRELLAGTDINGNPLPPRAATTTSVTRCVVRDSRLDSQRRRLGR